MVDLPTYRTGSRTYSAGLFLVERAWVSVNGMQVIPRDTGKVVFVLSALRTTHGRG
jgi:hypothetical protein